MSAFEGIRSLSLYLSALFIVSSITGGLFLVHTYTFAQARSPQSAINGQITLPLDVADRFITRIQPSS
jgi:hypothetical protein